MKTCFEYLSTDDAIKKLQKIKKKNNKAKILIYTIDFDNDLECKKFALPDEGCMLIQKSKTIIFNGDEFLPHMELFSIIQDINNIKRKGVAHNIIWCGG